MQSNPWTGFILYCCCTRHHLIEDEFFGGVRFGAEPVLPQYTLSGCNWGVFLVNVTKNNFIEGIATKHEHILWIRQNMFETNSNADFFFLLVCY